MENMEIGFICRNYGKIHYKDKLKLPIQFVLEYGSSMPEKLFIEMPSGEVWYGKYVKKNEYIEGLENMLSFYGVRPYHLVVFVYSGGPYFKFNIFNECGVEIAYAFSCPSSPNIRVRRNDPFLIPKRMDLTDIEIDKLAATFSFNALHNFVGLHDILIEKKHLSEQSNYEVISLSVFQKLCMDEGIKTIEFCFEHYYWQIRLLCKKGLLLFDKGWYNFVKEANISEGDICVIQRTAGPSTFKIAVLDKNLLTQWASTADNRFVHQRFSWVKIFKGSCLESGKVEMPRLFAMRLGRELGREIRFNTSDGRVFRGKYNSSKNVISCLKEIISSFDVYHNCVLVFQYVGNSTFNVSIFDSQNMDHLKDITGQFISDILRDMENNDSEMNDKNEVVTQDGDGDVEMHVEDDVEEFEIVYDDFESEEIANELDDIVVDNDQNNVGDEGNNHFVITLKKSHFDAKGRGVYCCTRFFNLYKDWNRGTIVSLNFQGQIFEVRVQRNKRSCRFGKGWDEFIRQSELHQGEKLNFRFLLPYSMEVSKII